MYIGPEHGKEIYLILAFDTTHSPAHIDCVHTT